MQPPTSNQPASSSPATRPPRVLIADDTPEAVELLEAYLAGTDYEMAIASDGEETLARVADWHPDLILLDIMMPKISGFEVCKRLRANPATRETPLVVLSSKEDPTVKAKALELVSYFSRACLPSASASVSLAAE